MISVDMLILQFFFSSRRRHTRLTCDWSSDVCSSDLPSKRDYFEPGDNDYTLTAPVPSVHLWLEQNGAVRRLTLGSWTLTPTDPDGIFTPRSEERRVGEEGRCRRAGGRVQAERWRRSG